MNKQHKNLNKYLNDSEKKAFIKDKTINIKKKNGDILNQKKLSSGENQLIYILLKICNTIGKKSVIILDEPEISLMAKKTPIYYKRDKPTKPNNSSHS